MTGHSEKLLFTSRVPFRRLIAVKSMVPLGEALRHTGVVQDGIFFFFLSRRVLNCFQLLQANKNVIDVILLSDVWRPTLTLPAVRTVEGPSKAFSSIVKLVERPPSHWLDSMKLFSLLTNSPFLALSFV